MIDTRDYKEIKQECESRIARLEAQLAKQANQATSPASIDRPLDKAFNAMIRIDVIYKNGTVTDKRQQLVRYILKKTVLTDHNIELHESIQ